MKADYLTFKTAASVSLRGLILQVLMASGALIYGVIDKQPAVVTAAMFMMVGVVAWLALTIVYDQHRRERIEAMEAESLAAGPTAGTSVFERGGDDFKPAAKRLAGLYKYFIPGISLLIGGLLVGLGLWRYFSAQELIAANTYVKPARGGWGIGVCLTIAVVGFVFARYAAGMAKQPVWANLRGGAAFAVGGALLGLFLAVAQFVEFVTTTGVFIRWVQIAVPAVVVFLGAETFLNFVLAVYRPRKAGEIPRPAFDSRLLGLLAAPDQVAKSISDAINYQLGFNVTGGWFYQLVRKRVALLALGGVVLLWLLSSVAIVRPHQSGMILRFGEVVRAEVGPGFHLKAPWPVDVLVMPEYVEPDDKGRRRVTDLTATGLRTLQLGTSPPGSNEAVLWTNVHGGEEVFQFVRTSARPGEGAGSGDFADVSMVSVELPLQYVVSNVRAFDELAPPMERDDLLRTVAKREVARFFQGVTLDQVLGGDREEISLELRERVQKAFDALNPGADGTARGAGVTVVFLGVTGVHPPQNTALSFEAVVQADQRREANIQSAQADAIRTLTTAVGDVSLARQITAELDRLEAMRQGNAEAAQVATKEFEIQQMLERAGGSAAETLASAGAARWERHMGDRGRAERYRGTLALYEAAPLVFRTRQYFEGLSSALRNARVFVAASGPGLRVDMNFEEQAAGFDVFRPDREGSEGQ